MTDTQQRLDWHVRAIRTPAHTGDPQPAVDAGSAAAGRKAELAAVLAAINAWPATGDELDFVFPNWTPRNAAKRASDLHTGARGSLIKPTGETRTTRAGGQATVWTTTAEGARIARQWSGIPPQQLIASGSDRHRAGLEPLGRYECAFDSFQYPTRAGLIQHQRRSCEFVKVIQ